MNCQPDKQKDRYPEKTGERKIRQIDRQHEKKYMRTMEERTMNKATYANIHAARRTKVVQYVQSMLRKCIMVKIGEAKTVN